MDGPELRTRRARLRCSFCVLSLAVVALSGAMMLHSPASAARQRTYGLLASVEAYVAPAPPNGTVPGAGTGDDWARSPDMLSAFVTTAVIHAGGVAAACASHALGLTCYLVAAVINLALALPNAPSISYCWRFLADVAAFYAALRLRALLMCSWFSTAHRTIAF